MLNDTPYRLHHVGIPTSRPRDGERYSAVAGLFTSEGADPRVQWHRYTENSPLPAAVRTRAHIALKVEDLDAAVAGETVLVAPYEPIDDYRVAIIEIEGTPIELVQTTLSDEALWGRAQSGAGTIYR